MTQKPLNESIYEELKRRILDREYEANQHVSEKSIAAQFNVSKTPVREALNQLCQEGYITRYPSFGYIIKELSYTDARNICELRYIVESAAARLIIRYNRDDEIKGLYRFVDTAEESVRIGHGSNTTFHWEMGKLAGNACLTDEILRLALSSMRPSSFDLREKALDHDLHRRIVDALLARDIAGAEQCLRDDILFGDHREL